MQSENHISVAIKIQHLQIEEDLDMPCFEYPRTLSLRSQVTFFAPLVQLPAAQELA